MKNSKGAFCSITSILKAAVLTLVLTVMMLGGVLFSQDVSASTVKADLAKENHPVTENNISDNNVTQAGFDLDIVKTDRMPVLPMPIMTHNPTVESYSDDREIMTAVPMFLDGEIDPGGSGQQVPISRPKL